MQNKIEIYFLISLFLVILGCQINIPDKERTKVTINNQTFEFITTFSLFDNYLSRVKNSDYKSGSNEFIFNPIGREILRDAETAFIFETIKIPYPPNKMLEKEIALLQKSDVIKIAQEALVQITAILPGPDTKIIFMPANPSVHELFSKYNMCINAITVGSGRIIILIDPTNPQWKETLPYVIAHEYHHSTWISRNWKNVDFSVLEYLIFEGRADAFATNLYKNVQHPWITLINKEQEIVIWNSIKPDLFQRGRDKINNALFSHTEIPIGCGYTIGFHIVQSFKQNHPEYTDKLMIDLSPEDIFKMSNYK